MDSSLLRRYETISCGIFEFRTGKLSPLIDHFTLKIRNVNSGFLALHLSIKLKDELIDKINNLISSNYTEERGYVLKTLTGKKNKTGAYKNYTVSSYNQDSLKADRIYELINCTIWEFMNELNKTIPFVLHRKGIMPPRIETYATNIDYRDGNNSFWQSLGVSKIYGQFINEKHKMFFENRLSIRYESVNEKNRLIYIFKDDNEEIGRFKSIKDKVYSHLDESSIEYFKFMFLDILAKKAGQTLVEYKHKLDQIKLKKNRLNDLLKLKYKLSLYLDDYNRIIRDDIWDSAKNNIGQIYDSNSSNPEIITRCNFGTYKSFCETAIVESKHINEDIDTVLSEFDEKRNILQNLYDYKNTTKNIRINMLMMIVSIMTLIFVIFPHKAEEVANLLKFILDWINITLR